jgi:hypothetical protein
MAKYGRIRSVYGMYTVVYDTVYDRLRPYTESVTVDLDIHDLWKTKSFYSSYDEVRKTNSFTNNCILSF